MLSGREATVRIWEATWGREGLWCSDCRRATPVEQLLLEQSGRALLRCETCQTTLRTGPSWLTTLPPQVQTARAFSTSRA
jgi:hypothetical protein